MGTVTEHVNEPPEPFWAIEHPEDGVAMIPSMAIVAEVSVPAKFELVTIKVEPGLLSSGLTEIVGGVMVNGTTHHAFRQASVSGVE